ncbi:hypothetical protein CDAR_441661 [Caerostris darwini]|uniref:Uncharacterized protein n=1 Tax=Caerostris darwini TaxID=1538125 RepID=A0AAV4QQU1_9ARAC|nr:hypothetical protein CDAR_441661 [Caerostris darwini]
MLFCAKRYFIPDEEASGPRGRAPTAQLGYRQLPRERDTHTTNGNSRMAADFSQMTAQHNDRCPVTAKPLNSWRNDVWYLKLCLQDIKKRL